MHSSPFSKFFPSMPDSGAYLDSAAKTLTCISALEAQAFFYASLDCNIERGLYARSAQAEMLVQEARSRVACLVGVPESCLAFCPSTTAGLNTIALGFPWREGQRVVVTGIEHHSNFLPWLALRRRGVIVDVLASDHEGYIDPDDLRRASRGATLVAFTHASNAIGTVQDLAGLSEAAAGEGSFVIVDGAQAVSHFSVSLADLPVDAYAFSGHKCFGPTGTGAVFISPRLRRMLEPAMLGGGCSKDSSADGFTLIEDPPYKTLEAGTPNIAGIIGFGAAAGFRLEMDAEQVASHTAEISANCLERLLRIERLTLFGPANTSRRLPVFSIALGDLSPHMLALRLDQEFGIMTRSGNHCTPTLWKSLYGRAEGATRISLHIYNGVEDVDLLSSALASIEKGS